MAIIFVCAERHNASRLSCATATEVLKGVSVGRACNLGTFGLAWRVWADRKNPRIVVRAARSVASRRKQPAQVGKELLLVRNNN